MSAADQIHVKPISKKQPSVLPVLPVLPVPRVHNCHNGLYVPDVAVAELVPHPYHTSTTPVGELESHQLPSHQSQDGGYNSSSRNTLNQIYIK